MNAFSSREMISKQRLDGERYVSCLYNYNLCKNMVQMSGIIENTLLSCSDLDSRVMCKGNWVPTLGNVRKCLINDDKDRKLWSGLFKNLLVGICTSFPEMSNHFANTAYKYGPIVL